MIKLPAILRYVISFAALFIALSQPQYTALWQKIVLVIVTILCTEWLFYFIPYLKRETK